MNALTRLQTAVIFQAGEREDVANRLTERARQMIVFGAVVAATLASQGANAQNQILTPSNCAGVGATVGGVVGAASGRTNAQTAVYAAIGALGGAAAGNWLCADKPTVRPQDSSYNNAAGYGLGNGRSTEVDRQPPRAPLSAMERERLDELSRAAIDAKYAWKKALYDVDQAKQNGYSAGVNSALEREAQARSDFERTRDVFSTTVARLNAGAEGMPARAVGRYIEISAALLELGTTSRVSYQMLEERDNVLKQRSTAYRAEADRVGAIRSSDNERAGRADVDSGNKLQTDRGSTPQSQRPGSRA